jgi:hypothetical protein
MNLRTLAAMSLCAWFAVVLELAWPAIIPRGSLLIPVICSVMLWERSAVLHGLGGLLLLLDWIARPTIFPIAPLILPLLIAAGGSRPAAEVSWRRRRWGIPGPLRLPLLAVVVLAIQAASLQGPAQWLQPSTAVDMWLRQMQPPLLVLLPVSGVIALLLQLAEELGLRRTAAADLRRQ